jgi:hypothetical protein
MKRVFAVIRSRGPAWDDSKSLEDQADWDGHSTFMDGLFEEGFAALVGPLEGTRDALLVLRAASEFEVMNRLTDDPWSQNGLLTTTLISPWQLRLGSLDETS